MSYILKKFKNNQKLSIAIAGSSGTGKTEISHILQELLWENRIKSIILSIDDYYSSYWFGRDKLRQRTKIIGKDEINWKKLNKVIESFKLGKRKLYTQQIHKYLNAIRHSIDDGRIIDCLILEGLYAAYADVDYKIYLNGSDAETYEFRKLRKKENPDTKYRKFVLKKEAQCVRQSKKYCSLIVDWLI